MYFHEIANFKIYLHSCTVSSPGYVRQPKGIIRTKEKYNQPNSTANGTDLYQVNLDVWNQEVKFLSITFTKNHRFFSAKVIGEICMRIGIHQPQTSPTPSLPMRCGMGCDVVVVLRCSWTFQILGRYRSFRNLTYINWFYPKHLETTLVFDFISWSLRLLTRTCLEM